MSSQAGPIVTDRLNIYLLISNGLTVLTFINYGRCVTDETGGGSFSVMGIL
jgi:hypothetical protein